MLWNFALKWSKFSEFSAYIEVIASCKMQHCYSHSKTHVSSFTASQDTSDYCACNFIFHFEYKFFIKVIFCNYFSKQQRPVYIRWRSDYVTLVTGPSKACRNSWLIVPAHNIGGKVWMKSNMGLHGFTVNNLLSMKPCIYFLSNFATYILCWRYDILGFVWTGY